MTMIRRMLQCLDDNKPVKAIHLKDAVFMMAKASDNVFYFYYKNKIQGASPNFGRQNFRCFGNDIGILVR